MLEITCYHQPIAMAAMITGIRLVIILNEVVVLLRASQVGWEEDWEIKSPEQETGVSKGSLNGHMYCPLGERGWCGWWAPKILL